MIVVAGPAGSGKSTAFPVAATGVDYFNIDDRAAALNNGSYRNIPIELFGFFRRKRPTTWTRKPTHTACSSSSRELAEPLYHGFSIFLGGGLSAEIGRPHLAFF